MLERFEGVAGRRLRIEALVNQKLIGGNRALAEALADQVQLLAIEEGGVILEQGASDNDVYLIISGRTNVVVNGRLVACRTVNDHVGEMAAIEPTQKRAASVIASEECVVAKLTEDVFAQFAGQYPEMYRCIARELARRLEQRNALVNATRNQIRVFIISSVESLDVARTIQNAFAHDPLTITLWTDGVFRSYCQIWCMADPEARAVRRRVSVVPVECLAPVRHP